jgi:CRP/FNR family cyclic AMP-dependent transcriptional regulator
VTDAEWTAGDTFDAAFDGAELLTIERVAVMHRTALFQNIPGHELVPLAHHLEEVRVAAGETIIEQGAAEDWFFIVVEGTVHAHDGDRTLRRLGPGDVVGDLAVLAPAPRSASVTADEACLLLRLRARPFDEFLGDHPQIARSVITTLARMLQSGSIAVPNHPERA